MIFGHLLLLVSWVLNIILSFLMIFYTTLGLFLCVLSLTQGVIASGHCTSSIFLSRVLLKYQHTMPLLLLPPPHRSGTAVSVTLAPMLCRSFLFLVRLYVINPEMFLSVMLASSVDVLDFCSIGCHLVLHSVLI
jgi:hypothetical protein